MIEQCSRRVALLLSMSLGCAVPYSAMAADKPAQTLEQIGTTTLFAQSMDWLDQTHFAVGRWDGTLSIFRSQLTGEYGPVVTQSMALPSARGVEMITAFEADTLVTSNNVSSLAVWRRSHTTTGDPGQSFQLGELLPFDASYGTANSGLVAEINGLRYFVSGHENGSILIWKQGSDGKLSLLRAINVSSPNAPSNPWGLRNVRGLAIWNGSTLVTGSEDGDLVGISLPEGKETFRVRYNPKAQRGINSISVTGDWLLVANCSVGSADKNLWLFDLKSGAPTLSDAENFAIDTFRPQTFNFDTDLIAGKTGPLFVSSTEEGLIWMGRIEEGQMIVTGITKSSPEGGSVMDISPDGAFLAAATYALRIYKLQ